MKLHVLAALACVLVQPLACSHAGQMQEPAYGSDTDDVQSPSESTPGSTGAANEIGGTANLSPPHTGNATPGSGVTTPSRGTSGASNSGNTSNSSNSSNSGNTSEASGANVGGANMGGTGGTTSSGGTGATGGTTTNGHAGNGGTSP